MVEPATQKFEYDRIANRLVDDCMLGHGLHEDLLIKSSHWFHERIGSNNECLADFFGSALENHVALIFALPSVSSDTDAADDLFEFLHHLASWVLQLPGALLRKSPEPLVLVVGHRGLSDQFGAHMMLRGGPSIIFWQTFSSIRKALGEFSYTRLSDQIGKTLVHEVIGHQLAFCSLAGPTISREDVGEILRIANIDFVKLNDGSSLSARDFVRSPDILAAIRRTEYLQSTRYTERYFGNLTELIAFAVEGVGDNAPYDYTAILRVLRGNLLREALPVNTAGDGTPIYRSHDLSVLPFTHAYVYRAENEWRETEALRHEDQWLCARECERRFKEHLTATESPAEETAVLPGQSFNIRLPFDAMAVTIGKTPVLASPLGLYTPRGEALDRQPESWQLGDCEIQRQPEKEQHGLVTVTNAGEEAMPVTFLRLKAATPAREQESASAAS